MLVIYFRAALALGPWRIPLDPLRLSAREQLSQLSLPQEIISATHFGLF